MNQFTITIILTLKSILDNVKLQGYTEDDWSDLEESNQERWDKLLDYEQPEEIKGRGMSSFFL